MEIPLAHLRNGESGVVISINETKNNGRERHRHGWRFRKRLEDMGLTPGAKVTVVKSAPFHGPIELRLRGSRLAIGRGMAQRVIVRVDR